MLKQNALFNKSLHEDAVDDEKQTEALHRALSAMSSPAAVPPVAAAPLPPPSAAPTAMPSMPVLGSKPHAYFPRLMGVLGTRPRPPRPMKPGA